MNDTFYSANKIERFLKKPSSEFQRQDIINYILTNGIEMINFRYVAEDGKLKTLNFVINSKQHLEDLFATGERVDGSSLFSFLEAGSSDLYVIPRFKTAFVNPFTEIPTLDILCSFYTRDGLPLENAPEYILKKAHAEFKRSTGYNIKALGELEYYVISNKQTLYPAIDQKGYHASAPYSKWDCIRTEAIKLISQVGGKIKYSHSEVGNFSTDTELFEQNEIEYLPMDIEDAADQLVIGKWILRMIAFKYGVTVSFAPKITVGKAGSGLHIHMLLEKQGKNIMANDNGLTDEAKKVIAGILDLSKSLTAFGNTIPLSYLRLVPHQEAPTNICWGDRNRSVLVRVPLGWIAKTRMIKDANPFEKCTIPYVEGKQTIEFRAPDGSADVYLLLAGLTIAAQHGLEMPNALELANKMYVDVNIFKEENKTKKMQLESLPDSCWESAICLENKRECFEKNNIFLPNTIDNIIKKLKSYNDKNLSESLYQKNDEIQKLVTQYLHCM